MSVIVKGMEMPRYCYECKVWFECFDEKPPFNMIKSVCPLVEVKEPHGRLGDLDALWDRMYKYSDNEGAKMPFGDNDFMIHRDSACELIEDAPTVIEAEGSEVTDGND